MVSKQIPQTLKGFRDFLPGETIKRNWLISKIRSVLEKWGYDPIETPTLEPLGIFEGNIGDDEKLFYKFKDPGDRDVALRYDQTVPTSRYVAANLNSLPVPFKRYQIQNVFRAEKPQSGRYREFLQIDADIFGSKDIFADAECVALSLDIFREIGIPKVTALVNDRKLYKGIPYEALSSIDKIKKIGEDEVVAEIINKGIKRVDAQKYLNQIKNTSVSDEIQTLMDYVCSFGFDQTWIKFDPTIVRSFSYSDGPIWEVYCDEYDHGSLLGGERYDKLVEKITGINIPATGFGLGFDRTFEAANKFSLLPKNDTQTKVLVTIFSKKYLKNALKIFSYLKKSGFNSEFYPDLNSKLDKQLKYADKKKIPYAVIVGPDEVKKGEVTLKDLNNKIQESVPEVALLTKIK